MVKLKEASRKGNLERAQYSQMERLKSEAPESFREPFVPKIRKELNYFGIFSIVGFIGLLTFIAGVKITKRVFLDKEMAQHQKFLFLESQIEQLKERNDTKSYIAQLKLRDKFDRVKVNLEREFETKLLELDLEQKKTLGQKNYLIRSLKNELDYQKISKSRSPASVSKMALPYNFKNADILRFKQQQEIRRLKELQRKREETFLASFNLSEPKNKEAFSSLQAEHELELYAKRRTFEEQHRAFRKEKFFINN